MIAALFVETNGIYFNLPNIDPWDENRDARKYQGPYPIIAHPPCARWGRYWFGGPTITRNNRERFKLGDDGGCFEAAFAAVKKFGGIIEHPEGSHAWKVFHIATPPRNGGWVRSGFFANGWTCCVEQGWYGHKSRDVLIKLVTDGLCLDGKSSVTAT